MTDVDPVNLPPVLPNEDPHSPQSLRADIEHIKWILNGLRDRTGGGVDIIESVLTSETYETSVASGHQMALIDELHAEEDLYIPPPQDVDVDEPEPVREFTYIVKSEAYTAVDRDFVEGRLNATIKLDSDAEYNAQIITGNGDSSTITIDGDGVELRHKGQRGSTVKIRREGTSIHWYRFNDGSESYWRSS